MIEQLDWKNLIFGDVNDKAECMLKKPGSAFILTFNRFHKGTKKSLSSFLTPIHKHILKYWLLQPMIQYINKKDIYGPFMTRQDVYLPHSAEVTSDKYTNMSVLDKIIQ